MGVKCVDAFRRRKGETQMDAITDGDEVLIRKMETAIAEWDGGRSDENYLELAERLLRLVRMEDAKHLSEKRE